MFLATLNLGEWSVKSWVQSSQDGMVASIEKSYKKHQAESDDRKTAKDFLLILPKLESHYCRSSTSKL